ncbi:MAG: hypothetical protein IT303_11110 [Dehalococcoidia bacterium]|nr:hypothetical protein [Dehalococcoidia bacterium]
MVYASQDSPKPGVYHSSALANRFVGQRGDLNLPDARIVFPAFEHDPVRWNITPAGPPPSPTTDRRPQLPPPRRAPAAHREPKARAAARRPPANDLTPASEQRTTT